MSDQAHAIFEQLARLLFDEFERLAPSAPMSLNE
jgi:hypothetical protein